MKPFIWLCVILCVIAFPSTTLAQEGCDGLPSRLAPNRLGRVTPGAANNVRESPALDAALVGRLEAGDWFTITGGPVCQDGYVWWEIATRGLSGYTVEGTDEEFWLELIPADDLDALAAAVSFDFTPIADNISLVIEPESMTDYDYFGPDPAHIRIEFETPIIDEFLSPHIVIYPIESFQQAGNESYQNIVDYADALRTAPDSIDSVSIVTDFVLNAARIYDAHRQFIEFNGGYGYRFIAQYAQYPAPLNSYEMFYTFQGVTADGVYYVSAILPLGTTAFRIFSDSYEGPQSDDIGVDPDFNKALREVAAGLTDGDFFPTLSQLDSVISSIRLDGLGEMPSPVTNRYDAEAIHFDYSALADTVDASINGPDETNLAWFGLNNQALIEIQTMPQAARYSYGSLGALQNILIERPDTPEAFTVPLILDPFLSLGNIEYIETDQLIGVRFLFSYQWKQGPIVNPLTYAFAGLSKDGRYSITVTYPVQTSLVPDDAEALDSDTLAQATSEDVEIFNAYAQPIIDTINNAESGAFTPDLETIDALFETMTFD